MLRCSDQALPVNMYVGHKNLPPDGQVPFLRPALLLASGLSCLTRAYAQSILLKDEMCDPEVSRCKVLVVVGNLWSHCKPS